MRFSAILFTLLISGLHAQENQQPISTELPDNKLAEQTKSNELSQQETKTTPTSAPLSATKTTNGPRADLQIMSGWAQTVSEGEQYSLLNPMDGTLQGPEFGIQAHYSYALFSHLRLNFGFELAMATLKSDSDSGYLAIYRITDPSRLSHDIHSEMDWGEIALPVYLSTEYLFGKWTVLGEFGVLAQNLQFSSFKWYADGAITPKPMGTDYTSLGRVNQRGLALHTSLGGIWWIEPQNGLSVQVSLRRELGNLLNDPSTTGSSYLRGGFLQIGYHHCIP